MKVTVAIPTYNNLKDLKRALDSVFMQDFEDYEIVITDDSKNNETEDYIKALDNPKIRYFHNIPSLGPSKNWNYMINLSKGEYIKILFDDDWFLTKDALRKMVELMDNNPQSDFGYCKQIGFKRGTQKVVHRHAEKYVKRLQNDPMELFLYNRISAPSVVIIRNSLPCRFDENIIWSNDTDYYMNVLTTNNKIAFIKEELIALGCPATQLTQTYEKNITRIINDTFIIFNKFEQYIENSQYRSHIHKRIIKILQDSKINDLLELKKILTNTSIPEFVVEYYTKPRQSLWRKVTASLNLLSGGGGQAHAKIYIVTSDHLSINYKNGGLIYAN